LIVLSISSITTEYLLNKSQVFVFPSFFRLSSFEKPCQFWFRDLSYVFDYRTVDAVRV